MIKVYHISPRKNRESILKKGLLPKEKATGRIQYPHRIFVSKEKSDLGFDYVNYENVDCWSFKVDSKVLKKDTFSHSKNHFYIDEMIAPENLKLEASY